MGGSTQEVQSESNFASSWGNSSSQQQDNDTTVESAWVDEEEVKPEENSENRTESREQH